MRDPLRQGLGLTNQVAAAPRLVFVAMAAAKVRGERRRARTDLGDGGRGRGVGCDADAPLDRPGFMDVERFDQTYVFARVIVEKISARGTSTSQRLTTPATVRTAASACAFRPGFVMAPARP